MHGAAKNLEKGDKIDLIQSPYKASLSMLMKLNKIDSDIFPIPSTNYFSSAGAGKNNYNNNNKSHNLI